MWNSWFNNSFFKEQQLYSTFQFHSHLKFNRLRCIGRNINGTDISSNFSTAIECMHTFILALLNYFTFVINFEQQWAGWNFSPYSPSSVPFSGSPGTFSTGRWLVLHILAPFRRPLVHRGVHLAHHCTFTHLWTDFIAQEGSPMTS